MIQLNIRRPLGNKESQHLIIAMLEAIMAIWAIWLERNTLICNIWRWDVTKLHLNCIKLFSNFRLIALIMLRLLRQMAEVHADTFSYEEMFGNVDVLWRA